MQGGPQGTQKEIAKVHWRGFLDRCKNFKRCVNYEKQGGAQ
jgi:hypothetical protein